MEEHQIGWIAAIIIGGIAGWLAEQLYEEPNGACDEHCARHHRGRCASWLLWASSVSPLVVWIGYLISGFIGACILIAITRAFSGGLQPRT